MLPQFALSKVKLAEEILRSKKDGEPLKILEIGAGSGALAIDLVMACTRRGLSQDEIMYALIMAIIRQESNFDPNAVGDAGLSIGYMQLHWAAAYDAGYRSSRDIFPDLSQESKDLAKEDWLTDGLDRDTNIQYGTGYISICYNQYKDDPVYGDPLKSTVSCYNLGRTTGPSMRNETTYVSPVVEFYNDYSDICKVSEVTLHHRPVGTHYSSTLKLLDFSDARLML